MKIKCNYFFFHNFHKTFCFYNYNSCRTPKFTVEEQSIINGWCEKWRIFDGFLSCRGAWCWRETTDGTRFICVQLQWCSYCYKQLFWCKQTWGGGIWTSLQGRCFKKSLKIWRHSYFVIKMMLIFVHRFFSGKVARGRRNCCKEAFKNVRTRSRGVQEWDHANCKIATHKSCKTSGLLHRRWWKNADLRIHVKQ